MSRNTDYTEELADKIVDGLMSGLSMVKVCEPEDMPHRVTVIRWMGTNEAFATRCARARTAQGDLMDDRILDTVNKVESGELSSDQARVMLSGLQWRASKLEPKKYGDKTDVTSGGEKLQQNVVVYLPDNGRDASDS